MSTSVTRRGFSVKIFLPDGDPAGVKEISKSNWSGMGLLIPRALFAAVKKRAELKRPGVYVLVDDGDPGPMPTVYVGEGDPVLKRLETHGRNKDFWTHAVIFTSNDQSLNKAHVKQLESRLAEMARAAKRCALDNDNTPGSPSLSAADMAMVEGYLDDMRLCLTTLGFAFFEQPASGLTPSADVLIVSARGVEARGMPSSQGFVVYAGSHATKSLTDSFPAYWREMHEELIRQGVLRDVGAAYELSQDYTFPSPSAAASVMVGRNMNGRKEWKTEAGATLKSIQEAAGGA